MEYAAAGGEAAAAAVAAEEAGAAAQPPAAGGAGVADWEALAADDSSSGGDGGGYGGGVEGAKWNSRQGDAAVGQQPQQPQEQQQHLFTDTFRSFHPHRLCAYTVWCTSTNARCVWLWPGLRGGCGGRPSCWVV